MESFFCYFPQFWKVAQRKSWVGFIWVMFPGLSLVIRDLWKLCVSLCDISVETLTNNDKQTSKIFSKTEIKNQARRFRDRPPDQLKTDSFNLKYLHAGLMYKQALYYEWQLLKHHNNLTSRNQTEDWAFFKPSVNDDSYYEKKVLWFRGNLEFFLPNLC